MSCSYSQDFANLAYQVLSYLEKEGQVDWLEMLCFDAKGCRFKLPLSQLATGKPCQPNNKWVSFYVSGIDKAEKGEG